MWGALRPHCLPKIYTKWLVNVLKLFTDWGFTRKSWQGRRGEYWVLAQAILMFGYVALPCYSPWNPDLLWFVYSRWVLSALTGWGALWLLARGLVDLGQSLTPLPYPRDDGTLIQTGVYGIVRHCLYGGVILLAIAGSIYWLSVSHLIATLLLFIFFDAKATQEEKWLCDRYPDYPAYQQTVKKLLPFIY